MKRTPLKRSPFQPKRRKPAGTIQGDLWRAGLGPCAMRHLSACDGRIDAHHILTVQKLRRIGRHDLLLNHDNRLALCRGHHAAHHSRHRPVPYDLLPAVAVEFADALELGYLIERTYPVAVTRAA